MIKSKKDTNLFTSILFLVVGILLFSNPGGVVKFITYIVGILFIIMGIGKIVSYYQMIRKMNVNNTSDFILGIVAVILGIIVIFCSSAIEFVIRLVMGGWILYSGILKLIYSLNLRDLKVDSWLYVLIVSIIMIICGLYVIVKSNLVFSTIGLILIIYSIIEIIQYIILPKNINPDIIK